MQMNEDLVKQITDAVLAEIKQKRTPRLHRLPCPLWQDAKESMK